MQPKISTREILAQLAAKYDLIQNKENLYIFNTGGAIPQSGQAIGVVGNKIYAADNLWADADLGICYIDWVHITTGNCEQHLTKLQNRFKQCLIDYKIEKQQRKLDNMTNDFI